MIARAHDERSSVAKTEYLQSNLDKYVADVESRRAELERQLAETEGKRGSREKVNLVRENILLKRRASDAEAQVARLRKALEEARRWKAACQDMVTKRKAYYEDDGSVDALSDAEDLEMELRRKLFTTIDVALADSGGQEKEESQ